MSVKLSVTLIGCMVLGWVNLAISADKPVTFSSASVSVNNQTYTLEYASSFKQRAQGLMHRESMCEHCGMLFNFQQSREVSMWMKNTLIPLDVAFIQANGKIVNIEPMQPHDLSTTSSAGEVLYAWEMNQGWFAKQGISIGDKVLINADISP